jgi:hypothetical protein
MHRLKLFLPSWVLVVVVCAVFLQTGGAEAASPWKIVPSPNPSSPINILKGVAAASRSDVWAVGNTGGVSGNLLIEHWNGVKWKLTSTPTMDNTTLSAVTAISANDAWAVGATNERTLTLHWNGTNWRVVSSPNPEGGTNVQLLGVTALSSHNVWAVGSSFNVSTNSISTLTLHWNGTSWQIVPSSNTSETRNALTSVTALSASNIWAVGFSFSEFASQTPNIPQTVPGPTTPLIEHWNGSQWDIIAGPTPGNGVLHSVTALSANNVWAVGSAGGGGGGGTVTTLIEHWNGIAWTTVTSPNPSATNNELLGVAATSASSVWAVGDFTNSKSIKRTLIERWNGTAWKVAYSPNAGAVDNVLRGVGRVPAAQQLWAVGNYPDFPFDQGSKTLIEFKAL